MKNILLLIFISLLTNYASAQKIDKYLVNTKTLNMRSGPGKDFEIISSLSMGDEVILVKKNINDWWEVDFEGIKGYVFSSLLKIDPYNDWEKKNYQSGVTPDCENVVPQYDYNLNNYLRIQVGLGTDVVVKLMKMTIDEDECIRIVYVRSGETYEIKNIPEGFYYLKIAYGKDYRQKIEDNRCYVKFIKNAHYEKGDEKLDFYKVKQPDQIIGDKIYKNWSVPSFALFLDVIVETERKSTFNSKNISEAEFNK